MDAILRKFIARLLSVFSTLKDWMIAQIVIAILAVIKLFPAEKSIQFVENMGRKIGPKIKRHQLALTNLRMAFPEKTEQEREAIATDMWGSMSRLAAEYIFLSDVSEYNHENPDQGNLEIVGVEIFNELRENPRPFIVFTAHTGNFELLPIAATKYGIKVSALFRPPNNRFIAKKIFSARGAHMSDLVPSKAGAAWTLAQKLQDGGAVGMLVDQKFKKGANTKFFGHNVKTNPLVAKLARQYECEVFPCRCIRLEGGRFRLEMEPAIKLPRNDRGDIDINATSQMLNDKVEQWVREYPGQWQWFHDRWNIKHTLK